MQTLDHTDKSAADLYWLALLITGRRDVSIDLTVEVFDSLGGANPFFSTWMRVWSRKVVISRALAAIREELAASALRSQGKRPAGRLLSRDRALNPDTSRVQLERALLAIDVFPRCALLLTVFEKLSLDDATILLDSDRDAVRHAQLSGLQQLAANLAYMQGGTCPECPPAGLLEGFQHA